MAKIKIEVEIDTDKDSESIAQIVEMISQMQNAQSQYNEEYDDDD